MTYGLPAAFSFSASAFESVLHLALYFGGSFFSAAILLCSASSSGVQKQ
jgi:hypothetical protein